MQCEDRFRDFLSQGNSVSRSRIKHLFFQFVVHNTELCADDLQIDRQRCKLFQLVSKGKIDLTIVEENLEKKIFKQLRGLLRLDVYISIITADLLLLDEILQDR